jgi:uncharacterized iron-regulated membrane protein
MYRWVRTLHKITGVAGSLFLILIALTGFFLALKRIIPGIRPATLKGSVTAVEQAVHPTSAVEAAVSMGLSGLSSASDVDRFEIHMDKGVYKVIAKTNFHEVQVDMGTGKVLGVGTRNDQLIENIHDLSFIDPSLRETLLPVVALALFTLGASGLAIYIVPILRRRKHRRSAQTGRPAAH